MDQNNPISQELLETIERYLKNTMPIEERNTFELKIKSNPILQQQIKDVESILFGVRRGMFKNKTKAFHEEVISEDVTSKKDKKVFTLNFKTISIAASIVVLVGGFWFFNRTPQNEAIFNTYFIEDRGLETNMGETNQYAFDDAMVDYKHGKYDKAIEKWNLLLKSQPKNDTLNYFLGVAHLANKDEDKAIKFLKTTVNDSKSIFLSEANFYLGLSYLKMDKTDLAIEAFQKSNSKRSKAIIEALKK
ncbi:tetratricopeptide repeat protein [Hyunsoonleella sp. SJ7]|uniref:Tetratricopeptide repeat protein n=1 Tax=Hyunsoonleella aquatilis TaxID=2762758 RepID=A0A923HCA8_9FLAO|nr:tetratricopeptide repeat protein [Hyunsoonleella aquatilis]MBC3759267.1 tetratricopeptide repeat protein [Hyunsoonleella aquatilis]